MVIRILKQFLLCSILVTGLGCSDEERLVLPEASLKGKITYKGKAVPHALVVVAWGSMSATGNADEQGNYLVQNVAAGDVKIGVNTAAGRGMQTGAAMAAAQGGDKSAKPSFVDVPAKFFEPSTSGISTNVKDAKGPNNFDIEIK